MHHNSSPARIKQRARALVKAMLDNYPRGQFLEEDGKIDYVLSALPIEEWLANAERLRTNETISKG